ncbi:MAG: RpiB/LacA/LacB family sugar-phosphate isomerase [Anaerolineae bacterium]|nr:RpiB/LacA/LacB family sugar-phosphate isomerase [Anaerolineae bacterium]
MRIAIGCDDAGEPLLAELEAYLKAAHAEIDVVNMSAPTSDRTEYYPDVAERVALAVASGDFERGILVCGTGLGMAMTACKIPGIRAATCHDSYSAERARKSNNAQVLTMGSRVVGPELAKTVLETWLQAEYEEGTRSEPKVNRMIEVDQRYQTKRVE